MTPIDYVNQPRKSSSGWMMPNNTVTPSNLTLDSPICCLAPNSKSPASKSLAVIQQGGTVNCIDSLIMSGSVGGTTGKVEFPFHGLPHPRHQRADVLCGGRGAIMEDGKMG